MKFFPHVNGTVLSVDIAETYLNKDGNYMFI